MADKSAPPKYMRTKFELWDVYCSWWIGGNCCCTPLIEWRPAPARSWSPPSLIVLPPTNNNPNQLTFLKLTLTFASEREFQRVSWVSVKATLKHTYTSKDLPPQERKMIAFSSCSSNIWMIFTAMQYQDAIEKSAADNFKYRSCFLPFFQIQLF